MIWDGVEVVMLVLEMGCKYRQSFTGLLIAYLVLYGPVPNRPWTIRSPGIGDPWFREFMTNDSHPWFHIRVTWGDLCWGCTTDQMNQHLWRWDADRQLFKLPQVILMCTQGGELVPQSNDFPLIGCTLEPPREFFVFLKKSKFLGSIPKQMSQNLWKRSLTTVFFQRSFRWSETQHFKSHCYRPSSEWEHLDFNPFRALWLCKPCMPVGWWVFQKAIWCNGNSSGLRMYERTLKARFKFWFTIVMFAMWRETSCITSFSWEPLSTYLRFLPHLVSFFLNWCFTGFSLVIRT